MARIGVLHAGKTQYTRDTRSAHRSPGRGRNFQPQPQLEALMNYDSVNFRPATQLVAHRIPNFLPFQLAFFRFPPSHTSPAAPKPAPPTRPTLHHQRQRCPLSAKSTTSPASQSSATPGASPRRPNPPTRSSIPGPKNSRGLPPATSISSPYWPTAAARSGLAATGWLEASAASSPTPWSSWCRGMARGCSASVPTATSPVTAPSAVRFPPIALQLPP